MLCVLVPEFHNTITCDTLVPYQVAASIGQSPFDGSDNALAYLLKAAGHSSLIQPLFMQMCCIAVTAVGAADLQQLNLLW